jgi:hypothetical protein
MRPNPKTFAVWTVVFLLGSCGASFSQSGSCSGMSLGQGASLNGFVPFQSTSLWNTDISTAQVDANSANIINFIGSAVTLHPDFGAGTFHNQTLGIPYQVVAGTQAKVPVTLGAFFDESDPGQNQSRPMPSSKVIQNLGTAIATCSCLRKTAAGYMSSITQA